MGPKVSVDTKVVMDMKDPETVFKAGQQLKKMRLQVNATLKDIASRAGCSESMLSKIERGKISPSLQLLAKLTHALGSNMAAVFEECDDLEVLIYRDGERPTMKLGSSHIDGNSTWLERLIPSAEGRLLHSNLHVVPPGGGSNGTLSHPGEEVGFLVEGFIELTIDGKVHLLGPNASFFFSSPLPHSYRNIGSTTAKIVWVNTPPV